MRICAREWACDTFFGEAAAQLRAGARVAMSLSNLSSHLNSHVRSARLGGSRSLCAPVAPRPATMLPAQADAAMLPRAAASTSYAATNGKEATGLHADISHTLYSEQQLQDVLKRLGT